MYFILFFLSNVLYINKEHILIWEFCIKCNGVTCDGFSLHMSARSLLWIMKGEISCSGFILVITW